MQCYRKPVEDMHLVSHIGNFVLVGKTRPRWHATARTVKDVHPGMKNVGGWILDVALSHNCG